MGSGSHDLWYPCVPLRLAGFVRLCRAPLSWLLPKLKKVFTSHLLTTSFLNVGLLFDVFQNMLTNFQEGSWWSCEGATDARTEWTPEMHVEVLFDSSDSEPQWELPNNTVFMKYRNRTRAGR